MNLLHKKMHIWKIIVSALCMLLLTACGAGDGQPSDLSGSEGSFADTADLPEGSDADENAAESDEELVVVGFSQLGAESDWRSAHSDSMRAELTEKNGFRLLFEDGQQKQANQIMAIRTFIQRGVDYIVLAPVTETGWDTVLSEAKEAGIPVIIVDRRVDVSDEDLFTCWIGSDFELEAEKMTQWLYLYAKQRGILQDSLHIVNIQGTIGSSAQIGRTEGLRAACEQYGWDLLEEVSGEFTQTKGREVMAAMLKKYDNLNVVYCENDNEALGAIEAIEAAGGEPGMDIAAGQILVLSFDGMNVKALGYCADGKIGCIAECNPLHGKRVASVIRQLENGETPEKYSYVAEELYSGDKEIETLLIDGKKMPVTFLTRSESGDTTFLRR